jgi:hypothetical protein
MDYAFTKEHNPLNTEKVWEDMKITIKKNNRIPTVKGKIYRFRVATPSLITYNGSSGGNGAFSKFPLIDAIKIMHGSKIFNTSIKDELPYGFNKEISALFAILKKANIIKKL